MKITPPTPLDLQTRRIRWNTGVPESTARTIALLRFGEVR